MIRIGLLLVFLLGINLLTEARSITDDFVTNLIQQNNNSRYCIVVGSFSSLANAQQFGNSIKSRGYEAVYRKNETGFYRVCLFDFSTEQEAKRKIEELKPKDALFKQVWVLAFMSGSEEKISESKTVQKPAEKAKPIEKSYSPPSKPKTNPPKPVNENVNKPIQQDSKVYARYSLVVGRYSSAAEAKQYGKTLESDGYSIFFRKEKDNSYVVCMYNMDSKPDAEKRLDKMRHIDGIFMNAWILGYDDPSANLSITQL